MSELALKLINENRRQYEAGDPACKRLEIGRCGLTEIPEEVFELVWLEELVVSNEWHEYEDGNWVDRKSQNSGKKNKLSKIHDGLLKLISLKILRVNGDSYDAKWNIRKIKNLPAGLILFDISYNQIPRLENLPNGLNQLRIRDNQITRLENLPAELTLLHISDNQITQLVNLPTGLTQLSISNNEITQLENLPAGLMLLYMSVNGITQLKNLPAELTQLSLSGNHITKIENLPGRLTYLDISRNHITRLENLPDGLTKLIIWLNQITRLENLPDGLKQLEIRSNKITRIENLPDHLTQLDIGNNNITHLENLPKGLIQLEIWGNQISRLENLPNRLSQLIIFRNQINRIENLPVSLIELDVSANQIQTIENLPQSLRTIDIGENKITDITFFKDWVLHNGYQIVWDKSNGSKEIVVFENPLVTPPKDIVKRGNEAVIEYFKALDVSKTADMEDKINNEVKLIIVGNSCVGKSTMIKYLKTGKVDKGMKSTHGIKYSKWKPKFKIKNTENLLVRIFDFGGQEYYHDTHHLFFNRDCLYLILWVEELNKYGTITEKLGHATNAEEIEIDIFPVEYWLDAVNYFISKERNKGDEKSNADGVFKKTETIETRERNYSLYVVDNKLSINAFKEPKKADHLALVVQNKIELEPGIVHLNHQDLIKAYPFIHDYCNTSVWENKRTGFFKDLLKECLNKMDILGKKYPGHWHLIKERLVKVKDAYLEITEFVSRSNKLLEKHNIKIDEKEAWTMLSLLKSTGQVYFFEDSIEHEKDKLLGNYIFLDIDYVINTIYKILTKDIYTRAGIIDDDFIKQKLKSINVEKGIDFDIILQIMLRYHLIYEHPENVDTKTRKYVVPQYLPENSPVELKLFIDAFSEPQVRYEFTGYFHKSIILEFFCRYGNHVYSETDKRSKLSNYYYWKNGLILSKNDQPNQKDIVMVEFDRRESTISIRSFGNEKPVEFINEIVSVIDKMTQGFKVSKMLRAENGKYVPWVEIEKALKINSLPLVHYKNEFYQLGQFKHFLDEDNAIPWKKVFISYSSKDISYLKELEAHLTVLNRKNLISTWHDRKLVAGEEWDKKIKEELKDADITIFLVSSDFLATDYIWDDEMTLALDRHKEGKTIVFPIIVRECLWEDAPFANLNIAEKAKAIGNGPDKDANWKVIIQHLKNIISPK